MYVCIYMYDMYMHEYVCAKSLQSCPTLCDTMDCSLPGSSVHGILLARILEWVALPSSRACSWPRDRTYVSYIYLHWQVGSLSLVPPGKPMYMHIYIYIYIYPTHRKVIQLTLLGENTYFMPIRWLYAGTILGTGEMALTNIDKHPFPHRDSITVGK